MRKSLSASERHDRKRAEHKRYYAQTAFKYERRRWTDDIMRKLGIAENRRVQGLGSRQREGIVELVAKLK